MSDPQYRLCKPRYWRLVGEYVVSVSGGLTLGYWLGGIFWGLAALPAISIALDVVAIRSGTYRAWTAPPPPRFGGYRKDAFDIQHFYVGGCNILLYILKAGPRVFIVGGPPQVDPDIEREADLVEIEALADRLNLPRLREIASLRRAAPTVLDRELALKPPDA